MKIVNNNQFAAFVPYVLIIDRPERVSVYNHSITCLQGIEELLFFPDDLYLKTTFYQILLNSFRYEATIETDPILIFVLFGRCLHSNKLPKPISCVTFCSEWISFIVQKINPNSLLVLAWFLS